MRLLIALLLLAVTVSAVDFDPFLAKGYVDAFLDKAVYSPGEEALMSIKLQNADSVVFNNGFVAVQLVKETEVINGADSVVVPYYFVSDSVMRGVNLASGEERAYPFQFTLPSVLKNGTYAFYYYFYEGRTPVAGESVHFVPGLIKRFSVSSDNHDEVFVSRLASVGLSLDQTGPVVNESNVTGTVILVNNGSVKSGLEMRLSIFKWNDYEEDPVKVQVIPVNSIPENKTLNVSYSIEKPAFPYAYSLKFELLEGKKVTSFYHQRFISPGIGVRSVRLDPSDVPMTDGEPYRLVYGVVGSADGTPVSPLIAANIYSDNRLVYSHNFSVNLTNQTDYWAQSLNFTPEISLEGAGISFADLQKGVVLISIEAYANGLILESYSQKLNPDDFKKGNFIPSRIEVLPQNPMESKAGLVVNSSTVFAFNSDRKEKSVVCTDAAVFLTDEKNSLTLFVGTIANRERKNFLAFENIAPGPYFLKVICNNANDVHRNTLEFSERICVTRCEKDEAPLPAPILKAVAGEKPFDYLFIGSLSLLLFLLVAGYYWIKSGRRARKW